MKYLKDKRIQIGFLVLLLLLTAIAGTWWFTRPTETPGPEAGKDNFTHVGDSTMEPAEGVKLAGRRMTYYQPVKEERQEIPPLCLESQGKFSIYENQICYFSVADEEDDFSVSIIAADSGDVLRTWEDDDFFEGWFPELLYVDAGSMLWALYPDYMGGENWILYNIENQKAVEIAPEIVSAFMECGLSSFAMWNDQLVLFGGQKLAVLDLGAGKMSGIWEPVTSYCLDNTGSLYYLLRPSNGNDTLVKYSLEESGGLWSTNELPSMSTQAITDTGRDELFLLGASRGTYCEIFAVDPETGKTAWELTTLSRDLTRVPEDLPLLSAADGGFAIGEEYQVYLSSLNGDLSAENQEDRWARRDLYIFKPVESDAQPADKVGLTITAPYVIDSVDTAARLYQRDHPEVTFFWDTQYLSAEDYRGNFQEYKDQFALRAMAGGLGDVVMVNGFGLDTRIITNTDAFADLSAYLDACSFKDELQWNQVETLRGEDGAIRALPLGVVPTYYVWNEELLNELNIDPDCITWSELLAMALEWKEDGTDLSLAASDTSRFGFEKILQDILLANLYAAQQSNGTVQLDQPYLRELMENLKTLMDSRQLVREVPQSIFHGSSKALFVLGESNRNVSDSIWDLRNIVESGAMTPSVAAYPKGEVNKNQQGYAYCWGLNAQSRELDAAWGFLQFLVSSEGFSGGLYSSNSLPLNKAAQETWANSYSREWKHRNFEGEGWKYFHQIQDALDIPCSAYEQPYGWYDAVCAPLLRYFDDEVSLDEAMAEANSNWERFVTE